MFTSAVSKSKLPAKWIMSDAMLAYETIEPTPPQLGSWELVSSMVTNDLIGTRTKHKQHATFPTGKNSQLVVLKTHFWAAMVIEWLQVHRALIPMVALIWQGRDGSPLPLQILKFPLGQLCKGIVWARQTYKARPTRLEPDKSLISLPWWRWLGAMMSGRRNRKEAIAAGITSWKGKWVGG